MGKRFNTRLIKDDYSYTVEQITDLYGVDVATVRRWIRKEGLRRVPKVRPYIVHSSDLKAFIEARQKKRKHSCSIHEAFCFRCQVPRTPAMGSATVVPLPNTCIRFQAKCSECGGKMNRTIRGAEWDKNHPLARYLADATREHNGVQLMPRECSLQGEESHA